MRRILALAVPSLSFALAAFACDDGSNVGGNVVVPDASDFDSNVAFDAFVPDVNPPDAGGAISVLVANANGAKAAVRVIFHDTTGAVIGETKTDTNGLASSATVPAMVTVLTSASDGSPRLLTFMGVTAGDQLKVVPTVLDGTATIVGHVSTTFTASPPNAANFLVQVGPLCSNGTDTVASPIVVDIYRQCLRPQHSVLASASGAPGTLGFAFMKGVAPPSAGSTVSVGPLTFAAPGTRTVKATNMPTDETTNKNGSAFAVVGADAYGLDVSGTGIITQADGVNFYAPLGFADAYESVVSVETNANNTHGERRLYRRETATADATAVLGTTDFNDSLPIVQATAVSTTNGVERPEVTITTATSTGAHSAYTKFAWFGGQSSGTWSFIFPGDQKTLKAPALPADATAFVPHDTVQMQLTAYIDGTVVPDYATAKKLPVAPDADLDLLDSAFALPSNGTLKVTLLNNFID